MSVETLKARFFTCDAPGSVHTVKSYSNCRDEEQQAQEQALEVKERCKANTFMIESANFMTQDTSSPLNARLATTINVTGL